VDTDCPGSPVPFVTGTPTRRSLKGDRSVTLRGQLDPRRAKVLGDGGMVCAHGIGGCRPVDVAGNRSPCPAAACPPFWQPTSAGPERSQQSRTPPRPRVRRGFRNPRTKAGSPAGVPKLARPGPGRPGGSKNRQPQRRGPLPCHLRGLQPRRSPQKGTKPRRIRTVLPVETPRTE
jgi:hypothetical protein